MRPLDHATRPDGVAPWHAEDGPAARALYGAAVLAYLGVLFAAFLASHRKAKSHWQLKRSAAEFIKSNCWRYAVHGAPFDSASERPEALFANRLEGGLQELRKVGWADPARVTEQGLHLQQPSRGMGSPALRAETCPLCCGVGG